MNELENTENDEVSLPDLWRILTGQKRWVIGSAVAFLAAATIGVFSVKPKWEATAVIQIGQIGQSSVGGPLLIEPPVRAIERMKTKSFEDNVLTKLAIPLEDENPDAALFRSTVSLKVLGTSDLIQVKVRAKSREQAQIWAGAVADVLNAVHDRLTQPISDRLVIQQSAFKKQIQLINEEHASLMRITPNSSGSNLDARFPANLLLSNLLQQKNAELRSFEFQILALDERLALIHAYRTTLAERVHVPVRPATPKVLLTIVLAALVGLIIGVIVAFICHHWLKAQA